VKRFDEKEQLIGVNNVKSSVQKGIRSKLMEQFPFIEDYLEQIIPKKDPLRIAKWWNDDYACNMFIILLNVSVVQAPALWLTDFCIFL